jgi:hypothetical protein
VLVQEGARGGEAAREIERRIVVDDLASRLPELVEGAGSLATRAEESRQSPVTRAHECARDRCRRKKRG